jgi:histidyl-tRNA synthetase
VRGLDYYTKTVFEFFVTTKEEKSLALGGGGRYDYLVKLLGGKETPAIGAAFGIERIMQAMKDINLVDGFKPKDRVFLAQIGSLAKSKSLVLMESLRKAKIPVVESLGKDSLKIQMTKASRIGSKFIIIIGQKEAIENLAIIKNMETGRQETVPLDQVVAKIKKG